MKLQISPKASNDIIAIKEYISVEYDNPIAANRIANKIINSYEQLEALPYIGKRLDTVYDIKTDYHFLVCDNYLIFYTVDEDVVSVDRVIHGKRDYCKLLFNIEFSDILSEDKQK